MAASRRRLRIFEDTKEILQILVAEVCRIDLQALSI